MDCLFSDLQIDPGDQGCFAIDATELLIYERHLDIYAHNILWQISNLGMHDTRQTQKLKDLCDYLRNFYQDEQSICIYEAALLPLQKPRIEWLKLRQLKQARINAISTLYIAPVIQRLVSKKYLDLLGMSAKNFKLSPETNTTTE